MSPNGPNSSENTLQKPALFGIEGELVLVRISVDPRHLEELLDALAALDFPVNPELSHRPGLVTVEFPAYASHVGEVRAILKNCGFDPGSLSLVGMLLSTVAALV
jgi:hypothetical protein